MTAPRHTARRSAPGRQPPRPSSITLAFASLALALALPIGAFTAAHRFDTVIEVLLAISGMVLLAVLAFLAATKRRAGVPARRGGLLLPALVSTGLIVATYVGVAYFWETYRGPYNDAIGFEAMYALGAMAIVTYTIVYATLSMARR